MGWTVSPLSILCLCWFCCLVAQSCPTLWDPMDASHPASLFIPHHLLELPQGQVHCVRDVVQPSRLLMPSSPSILNLSQHRGLFQESSVCIRWPKYWSFFFSISPSSEYSGLIFLKIDWFELVVQGTFRSLPQHTVWRHQLFGLPIRPWYSWKVLWNHPCIGLFGSLFSSFHVEETKVTSKFWTYKWIERFPWWSSGKESAYQSRRCRRPGFDPWVGKILWSRKWQPTPVFLPGKFHGQRSLVGCI